MFKVGKQEKSVKILFLIFNSFILSAREKKGDNKINSIIFNSFRNIHIINSNELILKRVNILTS